MKKTKRNDRVDPSRVRADGWVNILTGLGLKGKDKRMESRAEWDRLSESDAEQLYAADDIAAKVVDAPVEDSLREGWKLVNIDEIQKKRLDSEFHDRLKLTSKIETAWKYSRMYGGGGLLLVTDDTADFSTPLNPARMKSIRSVIAFTRYELQGQDIESDLESPNYGLPRYYMISPRGGQSGGGTAGQKFHHSRVIRFEGKLLPPRLFSQNNYWHDSYLNALQNSLLNFNTAHDSAALAVQDFRIAVFKLKNLQALVANNQDDLVKKRLEIVNLSKSIAKAVVIDSEGESFEYSATSFTGIPEILDKMTKRLQAGTPLPHTRLFGNSPSGMGGSGRHEEVNWYDYIASLQDSLLHPILMRLYTLIGAQTTIKIPLPQDFDIEFNPLWQMDEREIAEIRSKQAATDQIYLENGVLDSAEIRDSRFGTGKWAMDTTLKEVTVPDPAIPAADPGAPGAPAQVDISKQALNGAQISSVLETVQSVVAGALPRESAVNIILKAIPTLSQAEAEAIVGSAGKGFIPAPNASQFLARQDASAIQSLVFSKDKFKDAAAAKKWAEEHGFHFGKVDETGSSFRLRQEEPGKFDLMRSKELAPGVTGVIGIQKDEAEIPQIVRDNAKEGLALRQRWGRGGTSIVARRAKDLAEGKLPSRTTLTRMASYSKKLEGMDGKKHDDGGPTSEQISVMLLGGKEGIDWAKERLKVLDGGE